MGQSPSAGGRLQVRFDALAFDEDLRQASPAGRAVAQAARTRLERDGADLRELASCDPEHRDGTRRRNCVKTYLPNTEARWRMIFELVRDVRSGEVLLAYRAFGVGHPDHPWQPSA